MKTLTIEQVMDIEGQAEELLLKWIRSDPRLEDQFRQLRQIADDAGVEDLGNAYMYFEYLEELLAAEAEGWTHPAEVLDPDGTDVIGLEDTAERAELLAVMQRLCQARIDRGAAGEELQRLEATVQKIADAQTLEREFEKIAEKIAEKLATLPRCVARWFRVLIRDKIRASTETEQ